MNHDPTARVAPGSPTRNDVTDDDFAAQVEEENSPMAKLLAEKDAEIARLRARVLEMEAVHEDASGAILQAVAAAIEQCADIVRNAAAHHGLCCSDCEALADLVAGLWAQRLAHLCPTAQGNR